MPLCCVPALRWPVRWAHVRKRRLVNRLLDRLDARLQLLHDKDWSSECGNLLDSCDESVLRSLLELAAVGSPDDTSRPSTSTDFVDYRSPCLAVPSERLEAAAQDTFIKAMRLLPAVDSAAAVTSLPWCKTASGDQKHTCLNPYHYGCFLNSHSDVAASADPQSAPKCTRQSQWLNSGDASTGAQSVLSCDTGFHSASTGLHDTPTCRTHNNRGKPSTALHEPLLCPSPSSSMLGLGSGGGNGAWCVYAYWEKNSRVGHLQRVGRPVAHFAYRRPTRTQGSAAAGRRGRCINNNDNCCSGGGDDPPRAFDRAVHFACVDDLLKQHEETPADRRIPPSNTIERRVDSAKTAELSRSLVGSGVYLYRTEPQSGADTGATVSLYNRSRCELFVQSNTIGNQMLRLQPGTAAVVHRLGAKPIADGGAGAVACVRASFGKGWGRGYKRVEVSCCPCWIEVLFPT